MRTNNNVALNHIFTQNTLKQLISEHSDTKPLITVIKRYINDPYTKDYKEFFSEIYKHLGKNYRNEYFYKNTLLNKLLLGVHKPTTTTALSEIPISRSKADFVLINGKAVVYEIKTELDSFDRLENQLIDYYKAFNHVCVLTCESNKKLIENKLVNTPVGIYLLTKKNKISRIKEPVEDNSALNSCEIFKVLNKEEYESILLQYYGCLPDVTPVKYFSECKKIFSKINMDISYPLYLNELKKRNRIEIEEYKYVPYELKSLIYFSKYRKSDYEQLGKFLIQKFGG